MEIYNIKGKLKEHEKELQINKIKGNKREINKNKEGHNK